MSRRRHISTSGVAASGPGTPRGFGDGAANLSERYAATPITLSVEEFTESRLRLSVFGRYINSARRPWSVLSNIPTILRNILELAVHWWGRTQGPSDSVRRQYLLSLRAHRHQTFVGCSPPRPLPDDDVTWPRPLPVWPLEGAK